MAEIAIGQEQILRTDLHTHTTFSDGADTPESMIRAALEIGLSGIGITDHVYAPYDTDGCMPKDRIGDYCREIRQLAEQYEDRIRVYCGIEQDIFSEEPTDRYDYVIGSVHYVKLGGEYHTIDYREEDMRRAADYYHGDFLSVAEAYYDTVADVAGQTGCDIIGHFDLVTKLNGRYGFFDEEHPRYVRAWQQAADHLLKTGKVFEINTGVIARGYRKEPYPSAAVMSYLGERGARFVLGSDSHRLSGIGSGFAQWSRCAMEQGMQPGEIR